MRPTFAAPPRHPARRRASVGLPAELAGLSQAVVRLDANAVIVGANQVFLDWLAAGGPALGLPMERLLAAWLGSLSDSGLAQWQSWWQKQCAEPLLLEGADGRHLQFVRSRAHLLLIGDISHFRQRERALLLTARHLEHDLLERSRELESARINAERAQRSKSRFFAAASHDLLQPLNAARIYAAALLDIPGLDPVALEVSQRIDQALRNAEDIVDTLVDVARFNASNVKAEVEVLELDRLIEPLVDQYTSMALSRGLALRWRASGLHVESDPRLLRRILQNLIGNALRYTGNGGVLIGARRRGEKVRIEVWDTGPGIAPEQQPLVFEEFHRLERQSPWGERGLGLGLWICRRIATLLDHRLDLRSTPGRGSAFSIELSLVRAGVAAVVPSLPRAVGLVAGCTSRMLALVLEPRADVRAAFVTLLAGWGLEVLADADPVSALAALGGRQPLLLIIDEDVVGGWSLLEAWPVRDGFPLRLYFSTRRTEARLREARERGCLLLGKPLKPARLRALVEDAVRLGGAPVSPT